MDFSLLGPVEITLLVGGLVAASIIAGIVAGLTRGAAQAMGRDYGLAIGMPADLVLLDATDPADAVRRVAPALAGWKAGRQTFTREPARLLRG